MKGRLTYGDPVVGKDTLQLISFQLQNQNTTAANLYLSRVAEVKFRSMFCLMNWLIFFGSRPLVFSVIPSSQTLLTGETR
jgi:hypothetical protein